MILTTTNSIEGFKIAEYKGIVSGVAVKLRTGTLSFSKKKMSDAFKKTIHEVKEEAFITLKDNAKQLNANAIVGITVDYENSGDTTYLIVTVTGTAVLVATEK